VFLELNKGDDVEICIDVTGYYGLYCIRGVYEGENDNFFILKNASDRTSYIKDGWVITIPEKGSMTTYIAKTRVVVVKKYV